MSLLDPVWFFLALGLILLASELVVPGLVMIFVGGAALLVSGLLAAGIVGGWISALTVWSIASLAMVLGVRSAFTRYLPGQSVRQLTDEDLDAFGEEVDVVETVTTDPGGRIRFRGSTWDAQALQGELPAGSRAKIVARDNLMWIVERLDGWAALPEPPPDEPDLAQAEAAGPDLAQAEAAGPRPSSAPETAPKEST